MNYLFGPTWHKCHLSFVWGLKNWPQTLRRLEFRDSILRTRPWMRLSAEVTLTTANFLTSAEIQQQQTQQY